MPVDIEGALREGLQRTLARNGLVVAGLLFVLALLNGLFSAGAVAELSPSGVPSPFSGMPYAPVVGVSPGLAFVVWLVLAVATSVVTIGATRTFVTDETERLPGEHFTRSVVLAVLNLFVGGIIFVVAVGIGLVLLVVPGLFLLVSLFFWEVVVIVEDRSFVAGYRASWRLTRGHRWRLLGLGIAVAIVTLVVNVAFGLPGAFLPGLVAFVVAQVGSALVVVFTLATTARTYDQLLALEAEAAAEGTAEAEPAG